MAAGSTARVYPQQMVHFLRKSIAYTDNGSTLDIGTIPAGSLLIKPMSGVSVNVAFDGNSSNVLDIGPSTDSGTNLWMTSGSLASIAFVALDEAVTMLVSSDTLVQCLVTSTASAAAGTAEVIICYIPDIDG
jgi:hypothetical protein